MKKPAISIIVPIYGVEAYLPACVDSILNQSFTDFECILVDDGSPDGCPALCEEYARRDARVRVVHRENGGLSAARNSGLDIARGKYISFVDSDDLLHPQFLEILYRAAAETGAKITVCDFLRFQDGTSPDVSIPGHKHTLLDQREALWALVNFRDMVCCSRMTVAWNKLYRRELFDGLRYPEGKLHEDEFLIHRLLLRAERVCLCEDVLYLYRTREDSITGSRHAIDPRHLEVLDAFEERCRLLNIPEYQDIYPTMVECYFEAMIRHAYMVAYPSGKFLTVYRRYLRELPRYAHVLHGKRFYLFAVCPYLHWVRHYRAWMRSLK